MTSRSAAITALIDDAYTHRQLLGAPIATPYIVDDVYPKITREMLPAEYAERAALARYVRGRLHQLDASIVESDTWRRKDYDACTADELEVQTNMDRKHGKSVLEHVAVRERVIEFLRQKSAQVGHEVTPADYPAEVDAIRTEEKV